MGTRKHFLPAIDLHPPISSMPLQTDHSQRSRISIKPEALIDIALRLFNHFIRCDSIPSSGRSIEPSQITTNWPLFGHTHYNKCTIITSVVAAA